MISLPSGTRIWLVAGVTDMRKSFNGLGEQIQHVLDDNPFSGHLFIFRGRRGDTIKILWADADGLCLFTKRLEEGQFIWPAVRDGKISITRSQLAMLLDKLDWRQPQNVPPTMRAGMIKQSRKSSASPKRPIILALTALTML
ncbi:IS66 family element, Orf2 protein [Escherichia coli]